MVRNTHADAAHRPVVPVLASKNTTTPNAPTPVGDRPLLDGVAWLANGKGLTCTDETVLARLRRPELSASAAFNFKPDVCSAGVVIDRLLPREDDIFEENQLGTGAHAVLEHLMKRPKAERTKEAASAIARRFRAEPDFAKDYLDANYVEQLTALSDGDAERWFAEIDRRVHGLWQIEDPTKVDVYLTEMSFGRRAERFVLIGRVPFIGYIDRVDEVRDPATGDIIGYSVKDYKAGKFKDGKGRFGDDYGDQIRLYVIAVAAATGITPTEGALLFITYGKARPIDLSPAKMQEALSMFERAWDRMHQLAKDNMYPTKVGPLCGWCKAVNICPAAIAAGKTDLSNTEKVDGVRREVEGKEKKALPADAVDIPTVDAPVVIELPPLELPAPILEQLAAIATPQPDATAAHSHGASAETAPPTPKDHNPMTETTAPAPTIVYAEGDRYQTEIDGKLNPRSDAATAAFGLTSLAVEELSKAGVAVQGATVRALTYTFVRIVGDAQHQLGGTRSTSDALNCRLRGALRTTIETMPMPFGQDAAAWDAWVRSAGNRVKAIGSVAAQVHRGPVPETPWHDLAAAPVAAAA